MADKSPEKPAADEPEAPEEAVREPESPGHPVEITMSPAEQQRLRDQLSRFH